MKKSMKIIVLSTFLIMIIVNVLANSLPINGLDTGRVSDSYPNLFAPAGITFAIWGIIYVLLACFTYYQLGLMKNDGEPHDALLNKVGLYFSISSIANTIWIFTWHYKVIYLSIILMLVIFVCLAIIVMAIKKENLTNKERFFIQVPFSIYFGWITVATIANMTTLLVSLRSSETVALGFTEPFLGISQPLWAIIIIAVGAVIGITTIIANKDYSYGLVILWAYVGILIKHTSAAEFNNAYPNVIITVIIALVLVAAANIYALYKKGHLTEQKG